MFHCGKPTPAEKRIKGKRKTDAGGVDWFLGRDGLCGGRLVGGRTIQQVHPFSKLAEGSEDEPLG